MQAHETSAPVKVLYCEGNTDGTIGGSYYSLLYLLEGLRGTEFETHVVFHRGHSMLSRFVDCTSSTRVLSKPRVVRLVRPGQGPWMRWPALLLQRALNGVVFGGTILRYALLLKRERVRLLHLNNSTTRGHEWMLAACLTGIPYVVHERGINGGVSRSTRVLARRAAAVICISEAVRQNLSENQVGRSNLHLIPNGIDPASVHPTCPADEVRRFHAIEADRPVIGVIGNIKEWKGQEVVIRALPTIIAQVPNVACLFVGAVSDSDRRYYEGLCKLVEHLDLSDHVFFTGYRDNVADYLNVFDVALHSSVLPEPFGRVLLEAMALRKPVVASDGGGVPEIVSHGSTGFVYRPGDAEALAEYVVGLLGDPRKARSLGEAGYARLQRVFLVSGNVARTCVLYRQVLGTQPLSEDPRCLANA